MPGARGRRRADAARGRARPRSRRTSRGLTPAQKQARREAVVTLREQGYEPVRLADWKPANDLRVLVGRADTGALRAFFFVKREFVGNDDPSVERQAARGQRRREARHHAGVRPRPAGTAEKVRFEWRDGVLQPTADGPAGHACADLVASTPMCGRYTLTTPGGRALAERFVVDDTFEPATLERFNVCPTEPIAIVTADDGEDGGRLARTVRWGLVPPWARELGKGFQPINARAETAADKPPFAELMARPERRCLMVADGWYEWLKSEKKGGARLPFRYTVDGGGPFAFAGLWGRRRDRRRARAVGLHPHVRRERASPRRCTTGCRACWPAPTRRRRGWRARRTACSRPLAAERTAVAAGEPRRQQGRGRGRGAPDALTARRDRRFWQGSALVSEGQLLLVVGVLLAAGLAASLAAGRLRMPGLVLVLALGMAIGSDGTDWIPFDDFELARKIGVIALAFILFEGGLSAGFDEIRPVLRTSILLATLGTIGTAALTALAALAAVRRARAAGGAAARVDRGGDRRGRRVRRAARIDAAAAASRARWRASPASTTRSRSCS